jgi:predicted permease
MTFDPLRALDVLVVCLPVFAMMGLGKLLELRGQLGPERRSFVNWLVYYFALPALIFAEVSQQRFGSFLNPALTLWPLAAVMALALLTMGLARVLRYRGSFAAAFVFCTFWANVTYMGFPLCQNAFGTEGLAKAAIYNALVMPCFIMLGYTLIGFYGASGAMTWRRKLKLALLNPVVIAAILGVGVASGAERLRDAEGVLMVPVAVQGMIALVGAFLKLVGSMGLPMALLAIGASIHWQQAKAHLGALAYTVTAKLVLLPLITFVGVRLFFPETDSVAMAVAVILGATPSSIASYVVSCQMGVEEGFVSSALVATTVLSTLTLPLWLYLVLA